MRHPPLALLCALLALCSTTCHQIAGGGFGPVQPDGAPCSSPSDCASNACNGGTCGPPPAGQIEIDGDCSGGGACVADAACQEGICVETSSCAADGASCFSSTCCNGNCNSSTSTCGCSGAGVSCGSNSDCCSGSCDFAGNDTCM